jgi:hypothetical protein
MKRIMTYSMIAILVTTMLIVSILDFNTSIVNTSEPFNPVAKMQELNSHDDEQSQAEEDADDSEQFTALGVALVSQDSGFKLQFNKEQYPYVIGTVTSPTYVVHGIARSNSYGLQFDVLVVQPDQQVAEVFPVYELHMEHLNTSSLFTLIDEQHVMMVRPLAENNKLNYDLVKINLHTGNITVIAPQIWEVDLNDPAKAEDFFLSAHYEDGMYPYPGKLMLTSFKGLVWLIDIANGKVTFDDSRLFPAYGDPGSAPPRALLFPSPDLSRFVYQVGEGREISNDFQVYSLGEDAAISQFNEPYSLMSPGIVWNEESSMFFLEYADYEPHMGAYFDNANYVFAQGVHFYDRDGTLVGEQQLPKASTQRLNVYAWMDNGKALLEYYHPQGSSDSIWTKGEMAYKLYDVHTNELTIFTVTEDLGRLMSPVTIRRHVGLTYGSSPFLLMDLENQLIWESPIEANAIYGDEKLYIQTLSEDAGHIYSYDERTSSWEWEFSETGDYYREQYYFTTPNVHHDHWLSYPRYFEKQIDYYDMVPTIERNANGLPVLQGSFAKDSRNGEWWNTQNAAKEVADSSVVRMEGASRYGKLQLRSGSGELALRYGAAYQYYGFYQIQFIDIHGQLKPLQSDVELALFQEESTGSIARYEYDGFDILLLQPNNYRFSKGFDGGVKQILAFAVTSQGEAFRLDFQYAIAKELQRTPAITIYDHAPIELSGDRLIVQSLIGEGRFELILSPNLEEKTLTIIDLADRTVEYNQLQQIVSRYANRLEQALGLEDIALPEGRMEEEQLRELFTDQAWNNPGFQYLKSDFARSKEAGYPSRAFAWNPIDAKFLGPDSIKVTYTLNLWYAIGLAAHLEAEMKLVNGKWIFHDLGKLETEKVDEMPEYSGLVIEKRE